MIITQRTLDQLRGAVARVDVGPATPATVDAVHDLLTLCVELLHGDAKARARRFP